MANIDMIELLELPGTEVIRTDEDGILLRYDDLFLLAANPGRALSFLPVLSQYLEADRLHMIVVRGEELLSTLTSLGFTEGMNCFHAVYPSTRPVPYPLPEGTQIRPLDSSHAAFVHEHYHTVDDLDYIRERVAAGMFGAFVRGELAGFVGTHEERSMGLLEVVPAYRRLGLAFALEAHMINHLLSLGRTPFCQVSVQNEPSILLQKKIGMTLSDTVIHWRFYHHP